MKNQLCRPEPPDTIPLPIGSNLHDILKSEGRCTAVAPFLSLPHTVTMAGTDLETSECRGS